MRPPAPEGGPSFAWYVLPRRVDAWLAYRILCAGLVSVIDLGAQAYEYYCGVGTKFERHFDQIRGSIICAKLGPIQFDRHFTAVRLHFSLVRNKGVVYSLGVPQHDAWFLLPSCSFCRISRNTRITRTYSSCCSAFLCLT